MKSYSMNTNQLEAVISQFPPRMITRTDSTITVKGKRKSDGTIVTMLSAVKPQGAQWHVMAIEGMLSPK